MSKYKKILTSSLTILGTCLSLVGCNMGGNDSGNRGGDIPHDNVKSFEYAFNQQKTSIINDIALKLSGTPNRFISNPGRASHWFPTATMSTDVAGYNLLGEKYLGEKDNLIFGTAEAYFGQVSTWDGSYDYEMPVFISFDKNNNMLYSSENSGFTDGLAQDQYGAAFDYDFSLTGLLFPYLLDKNVCSLGPVFFTHDEAYNSFGSIDLWGLGYNNIISIQPNDGKLSVGMYQGNLSFLDAKITFLGYRYGGPVIDKYPGERHYWWFCVNFAFDQKTNELKVTVDSWK